MAPSGMVRAPAARARAFLRDTVLLGTLCLTGCTPPWYWFSTVEAEGRFLPDGRCTLTVRGDLTRSVALRADAFYVSGDNIPPPLPPTALSVTCGTARGDASDASSVRFYISLRDTVRGVAPGAYRLLSENASPTDQVTPGTATALVTVYPNPPNRADWRDYRVRDGQLTLTAVTKVPDGTVRIVGGFRLRGHRYFRFE